MGGRGWDNDGNPVVRRVSGAVRPVTDKKVSLINGRAGSTCHLPKAVCETRRRTDNIAMNLCPHGFEENFVRAMNSMRTPPGTR
jgi:hypothetical protein